MRCAASRTLGKDGCLCLVVRPSLAPSMTSDLAVRALTVVRLRRDRAVPGGMGGIISERNAVALVRPHDTMMPFVQRQMVVLELSVLRGKSDSCPSLCAWP